MFFKEFMEEVAVIEAAEESRGVNLRPIRGLVIVQASKNGAFLFFV